MSSRGVTYVTVGNHGFYYRETLSSPNRRPRVNSSPPPVVNQTEDAILSAGSLELVDSSSERLIKQLNDRANMINPAWFLYAIAVVLLLGLPMVPPAPVLADLPEATLPSAERNANTVDEYSKLTARFGEPDSIVYSEAYPSAPVPEGTARYTRAHVRVVFVPTGCVEQYSRITAILADTTASSSFLARHLRTLPACKPLDPSSWTTVGYLDSTENTVLTAAEATQRLSSIQEKGSATPFTELQSGSQKSKRPGLQNSKKATTQTRPEMKSSEETRLEAKRLTEEINTAQARAQYAPILLGSVAIALVIAAAFVHKKNKLKRETHLIYELDEVELRKYGLVQESLRLLSNCQRVWRIEASTTSDWKRNAGASSLVRRSVVNIRDLSPPRVKANVQVPSIDLGQSQLYFLPDTILFRDGRGYGGIRYGDFGLTQGFTSFIEDEAVPHDATVVDQTWRFVNKNGSPDLRFNNNRQLPVLRFGVLVMTSSKGLYIKLNTSNGQQSEVFARCWEKQFEQIGSQQKQREYSQPPPPKSEALDSTASAARRTLGVSNNALRAEITDAYHKLAQMYHPDKVAGLAPEFQELGEKRMKEINAAYELLKNSGQAAT